MKQILNSIILLAFCAGFTCCISINPTVEEQKPRNIVYGIDAEGYQLDSHEVIQGDTWGKILDSYGITVPKITRLQTLAKDICPLRTIRIGHKYTTFTKRDSLDTTRVILDHLVYEQNLIDYVVFSFVGDSVAVRADSKPVTLRRTKSRGVIESSLWGTIMQENMPYALAAEMEDIYQWTVDFFGIQQGDSFTVIYDEKFVDTLSVGIGRVWGAKFNHAGKDVYAIPFKQDDKIQYWEYNGASLRKQLLKAPLKFSRVSSRFSRARLHPVHRVYRPHLGVDYAAPKGTPVHAVADGVVTFKGWGGGGGNTLKIKHAGNLVTGYLHLSSFAKGIKQGSRVRQGELIGYVGSTGTSTGPHLDYRIWKNGVNIDPLKVPQEPAEPIKKQNMEAFEHVRDRIIAELDGKASPDMIITQLDSLNIAPTDSMVVTK